MGIGPNSRKYNISSFYKNITFLENFLFTTSYLFKMKSLFANYTKIKNLNLNNIINELLSNDLLFVI